MLMLIEKEKKKVFLGGNNRKIGGIFKGKKYSNYVQISKISTGSRFSIEIRKMLPAKEKRVHSYGHKLGD